MSRTIMQADEKVKRARDALPVLSDYAYLDTGSVGPISTIYAETLAHRTEEDLRRGRALSSRFDRITAAKDSIRRRIASLLGTDPASVELTRGTTDGIRTLLARIPWSAGDEIVTTQLEFPPCADAIGELEKTGRVTVRVAEVPEKNVDDLGWLERCVTPKTRLIAFSGVAFTTGLRLPLESIAEFARARDVRTLVDGAQLIGSATPDMARAGIDFLALPLQKWLCGPEGLGALYIKETSLPSRRQESIVHGWPVLEAAAAHLAWLEDDLGWSWIHERCSDLGAYAREALEDIARIRLVTPAAHAGLVSIELAEGTSQSVFDRLTAEHMIVRHRPELDLLRISTAFFVTESEIDRFAATVRAVGQRHPKYAS